MGQTQTFRNSKRKSVRFTPESGPQSRAPSCLFWANFRHQSLLNHFVGGGLER